MKGCPPFGTAVAVSKETNHPSLANEDRGKADMDVSSEAHPSKVGEAE